MSIREGHLSHEAPSRTRATLLGYLALTKPRVIELLLVTTIPAMLLITAMTGHELVLGVEHGNLVLLLLTLGVSVVTFASGRTHVLQGAVHVVLFLFFLLLTFKA